MTECPIYRKKIKAPVLNKEQLKEELKKYVEERDKKAKAYVCLEEDSNATS